MRPTYRDCILTIVRSQVILIWWSIQYVVKMFETVLMRDIAQHRRNGPYRIYRHIHLFMHHNARRRRRVRHALGDTAAGNRRFWPGHSRCGPGTLHSHYALQTKHKIILSQDFFLVACICSVEELDCCWRTEGCLLDSGLRNNRFESGAPRASDKHPWLYHRLSLAHRDSLQCDLVHRHIQYRYACILSTSWRHLFSEVSVSCFHAKRNCSPF